MKKIRVTLLVLVLSLLLATTTFAAPPLQEDGEVYTVQAGDWLSKIAEKYYGDVLAYPTIVAATNAQAAEDDTFATIDNPDLIEVGQQLWIPSAAMASDPETTATEIGMANPASVYCAEQGGQSEIRTADDGSQVGFCRFDDGSDCEEWAFMRGECMPGGETTATPATETGPSAAEVSVTDIVFTGLLEDRKAEVSGMDWFGDNLIMLPQYPTYFTNGGDEGYAFALPKADILAFLDGTTESLTPVQISVVAPGITEKVPGFQGFEAIAFAGGTDVYVTIEAEAEDGGMSGYLARGTIANDLSSLTIDTETLTKIDPQAAIGNMAEETLLVVGDSLLTLYEANGAAINAQPVAHRFGMDLAPTGTVPLANVEYRLTDATQLDANNRFWAINYFFPGDEALTPAGDPLAETYGEGETHSGNDGVERLVQFQYADDGITLVDTAPIQMSLMAEDLRNWEGLVRLDERGFLLMTDKYPGTILGFVPYQ